MTNQAPTGPPLDDYGLPILWPQIVRTDIHEAGTWVERNGTYVYVEGGISNGAVHIPLDCNGEPLVPDPSEPPVSGWGRG